MSKQANKGKGSGEIEVIVPDILHSVGGMLVLDDIGKPRRRKAGGFEVDVRLTIEIADEQVRSVQLPQAYNHYRTALIVAASGGEFDHRKRRFRGVEGTLELHAQVNGVLELALAKPLECVVKGDEMICTKKRSRYSATFKLACPTAEAVARVVDLHRSQVRALFRRSDAVASALPPEPDGDLEGEPANA